jgi:hypothetical protein
MTESVSITLGSPNGDGKRSVVYRHGDNEYPDRLDVQSGWQRQQSVGRALKALGLPADNLSALESDLARLAKEQDQKNQVSGHGGRGRREGKGWLVKWATIES